MARAVFYVEVSGSKLAWNADDQKYTSAVNTELGIKKAVAATRGLVFGANQPRLPRLRLNFEGGLLGARPGSQIVFCAPSKVANCTVDNKLKGKSSNGKRIKSASVVGSGT